MEGCASFLDHIEPAPTDPIFLTKQRYKNDTFEKKVNLGIGAYRTNEGKPFPLPVVKKAEGILLADATQNKEYLSITGHTGFLEESAKMLFGANFSGLDRVAKCQSLSGTGGLRLAAEFVKRHLPGKTVYLSNPTWGNHKGVLNHAGVKWAQYRYWDAPNRALDITGMLADIRAAPPRSVIMLHACAHNPTGVDPTPSQWRQILDAVKAGDHLPWFDSAYQGFASGDLDTDAGAVRTFAAAGSEMLVSMSFAKNFGLYNERAGCVFVLAPSPARAKAIVSQFAKIVRPMYSNPPAHGAKIVHTVLSSGELFAQWKTELKSMADRINGMRRLLRSKLEAKGTPGSWRHITDQIGMFTYTGLTPAQVKQMIDKHHVYLLNSGRISMAGVNSGNVDYLANAIDDVVRNY
jgi:aspartate/tyrosine/aromatic aminotransferase